MKVEVLGFRNRYSGLLSSRLLDVRRPPSEPNCCVENRDFSLSFRSVIMALPSYRPPYHPTVRPSYLPHHWPTLVSFLEFVSLPHLTITKGYSETMNRTNNLTSLLIIIASQRSWTKQDMLLSLRTSPFLPILLP